MKSNDKTKSAIGRVAAYGAALWALIFAVLHIAWAMGWYIGLREDLAQKAFEQRWFVVYDLIAAGLCLLAVVVMLALVRSWGRKLPRSLILALVWSGTMLLVLRAGAALAQAIYFIINGKRSLSEVFAIWDVWFCLGAILFSISTCQLRLNLKRNVKK